jgi:hypothetical protein
MSSASKFSAYDRAAYLATVPVKQRALAEQLCDLLEASFSASDIQIYGGFPIVVRDMEWIAGFAMRAGGPVAYCCSPATLAELGAELKPYMSGKSCVAVKPRKGETIDVVLALVARAFTIASKHGGMISKTDAKKREAARKKQAPSSKRAAPAKTEVKRLVKGAATSQAKRAGPQAAKGKVKSAVTSTRK